MRRVLFSKLQQFGNYFVKSRLGIKRFFPRIEGVAASQKNFAGSYLLLVWSAIFVCRNAQSAPAIVFPFFNLNLKSCSVEKKFQCLTCDLTSWLLAHGLKFFLCPSASDDYSSRQIAWNFHVFCGDGTVICVAVCAYNTLHSSRNGDELFSSRVSSLVLARHVYFKSGQITVIMTIFKDELSTYAKGLVLIWS